MQGYEAKVWMADEVKTPCKERLGSEYFREMQQWTEKRLQLR